MPMSSFVQIRMSFSGSDSRQWPRGPANANSWLAPPKSAAAVQGDAEARMARATAAIEARKRFDWPSLRTGTRDQRLPPLDFDSTDGRSVFESEFS